MDGSPESGFRKLWFASLISGTCVAARYSDDLDDEHADEFAVAALVDVNGRVVGHLALRIEQTENAAASRLAERRKSIVTLLEWTARYKYTH